MNADTTTQYSPLPDTPVPARRPRQSHRKGTAVAVALLALGAGLGSLLVLGGAESSEGRRAGGADVSIAVEKIATDTQAAAADTKGVATQDVPAPGPAPEAPTTTTPPPPPATPGHLVVNATHLVLAQNDFDGTFQVRNDGGSPIDWQFLPGHPSVKAEPNGGTLAPGEMVVVHFTISWQQLNNGGFVFLNHVNGGGQSLKLTLSGSKNIVVNPGIPTPDPKIKLG